MAKKKSNHLGRNFSKQRDDDRLSVNDRSKLMAKIRSKETKLELNFIDELERRTRKKFRTYAADILGKPDIVFDKYKVCIFIDSDFWHGWQYPRWKHLLKNDYWRSKIERNRKRDKRVTHKLRKDGWNVVRLWEHNIKKDRDTCITKVLRLVSK